MNEIFLDPAHGGEDLGATHVYRDEKNDTLRITQEISQILDHHGIPNTLTRDSDILISVEDRVEQANRSKPIIFISFQRNHSSTKESTGLEALVKEDASDEVLELANKILMDLTALTNQVNLGVTRTMNYPLERLEPISLILLLGYITNTNDNMFFDQLGELYAQVIAKNIEEFYLKHTIDS